MFKRLFVVSLLFAFLFALCTLKIENVKQIAIEFLKLFRNEEPHVKKRMGKHGEKVDLILRVDLVSFSLCARNIV